MPQQNALVGRQAERWLDVIVSVFIVFVWRQTTPWSYVGWKEKNFSICSGRLTLESCENDTRPASSSQLKSYCNEREEFCHLYKAGSPWRIVRMTHDLHHLLNCNYIILMKRMDYIIQFSSCPSGAWYQLLYVTSPILISISILTGRIWWETAQILGASLTQPNSHVGDMSNTN